MELISLFIVGSDKEKIEFTRNSIELCLEYDKEIFEVSTYCEILDLLKSKVSGKYITILTEGDSIEEGRYSAQILYLKQQPQVNGVGGGTIYVNENNYSNRASYFVESDPEVLRSLCFFETPMDLGSILFDSEALRNVFPKCIVSKNFLCRYLLIKLEIAALEMPVLKSKDKGETLSEKKELTKRIIQEYDIKVDDNYESLFDDVYSEDSLALISSIIKDIIVKTQKKCNLALYKLISVCRNFYLQKAISIGIREGEAIKKWQKIELNQTIEKPLVSVIIPTYNRSDTLVKSVESVIQQMYDNIEIIVVDDCSTDDTKQVVEKLRLKDKRILYVKNNENGGPAKCRNLGVRYAKGEYIAFHDDDDEWHVDKLYLQLSMLISDKNIDAIFGKMSRYRQGIFCNQVLQEFDWYNIKNNFFQEEIKNNYVGAPTVVIKKEKFNQIGGFNETLRCLEDWEFSIRMARELRVDFLSTSLIDVNITDDSVSYNKERFIGAWAAIFTKYYEVSANKGQYLTLMRKHLRNEISKSDSIFQYLQFAKNCLKHKGVKEELISILIDEDEVINYKVQQDVQEKCLKLQNELEKAYANKEELQNELEKAYANKEELQNELEKAYANKEELQNELEKAYANKEELQNELEKAYANKEELQNELEKAYANKEELQNELEKAYAYKEELQNELRIQMKKIKDLIKQNK